MWATHFLPPKLDHPHARVMTNFLMKREDVTWVARIRGP
jgi:hypothetical protein